MSYQDGATPLANLCQKAGSTLDEVLALDEDELLELSKEIVGNGVLDHARVVRQWRRCKLEEHLRKEIELELANEGQDMEEDEAPQVREEVQEDVRVSNGVRQQQEDVIGESWQQYLRKQIREEMEDTKPPPVSSVFAGATRTTASGFTEDSGDEYETFVESITLDPSSSFDDDEAKTTYNPMEPLGAVASDMMGFIESGITSFFEPELPKKKPKKKPPKSLFESGLELLYPPEEPERKKNARKKKKPKSLLNDGLAYFIDDSRDNKENNKQKKSEKNLTRSKSNRWMRQQEPKEQIGETYKLVPTRSMHARHKFHC